MKQHTKTADFWLLPEGVDALTPEQSQRLEQRRRRVLDLFTAWGYRYVTTPLVEFVEPLLNGAGQDLTIQTQKVTDQLSGRLLGIRADMTPQVARLDVHDQTIQGPARYCYADTVYHARPKLTSEPSRLPFQTGVELFGHHGVESDLEIISLMLESLQALEIENITLDIGHIAICKEIFASFDTEQQAALRDIYSRKCRADLTAFIAANNVDAATSKELTALLNLSGDASILKQAKAAFSSTVVNAILDDLIRIAETIAQRYPQVNLYFDLSELRSYEYHTGCVFAAYTINSSRPVAKGGRYDDLACLFGRDRPATGLTIDLKHIGLLLDNADMVQSMSNIYAPPITEQESQLYAKIQALRAQGESVIQGFADTAPNFIELGCDRQLVLTANEWQVVAI